MIIFFVLTTLMVNFVRSTNQFISSSNGTVLYRLAFNTIEEALHNVGKLSPDELLVANGTLPYNGISNLDAAAAPSECNANQGFSVLRLTSILKGSQSETLLRPWNAFSATSGRSLPSDELRITYDPVKSAFAQTPAPTEIFLIDVDGLVAQRYSVRSSVNRKTNLDPYSDLPATDPATGAPMQFTYTAVFLSNPKTAFGGRTTGTTSNFITQSLVYFSTTSAICVSKTDGALVRIDEQSGNRTVLLDTAREHLAITLFQIEFGAPLKTGRLDQAAFTTDYSGFASRECVNFVRIRMNLSDRTKVIPDSRLRFENYFLLPNLNASIGAGCP